MKKIRAKIKEVSKRAITLEAEGLMISVPSDYVKKPKVGEAVVLTFATEKEDAMSAREVAHELIRTALRGE